LMVGAAITEILRVIYIFASAVGGLDADDEPLFQDPPRLRQGAQLGSVLWGSRRLHRSRAEVAPSRLGFRQRKMAVRIRQQRHPERPLRLRYRVGLTFPLGDRLRDIRETHHDHAGLLARLETGSIHKSS